MKLSEFAKRTGVTYKTAWRMFNRGELNGYKMPNGTIIIDDGSPLNYKDSKEPLRAALYVRSKQKNNKTVVYRCIGHLRTYASQMGYIIAGEFVDENLGDDEFSKKFNSILIDLSVDVILVNDIEQLESFGYKYISTLLEMQRRKIIVLNIADKHY